jgi:toxin ParE1/3/4
MTLAVHRTPAAVADLVDAASYLAEESPEIAERFLDAVDGTFELLQATPEIGGTVDYKNQRLAGLRVWRVKGFEKYLVFYRCQTDRVVITRILHGARDIASVLEDDS